MNQSIYDMLQKAKTEGLSAAIREARSNEAAYFPPSDEPLGWDTGGVVRLDAAILTMHLSAARIALRSVPEVIRQKLVATEQAAVKYVAGKAVKEIAILAGVTLLRRVLFLVGEIYAVWNQMKFEQDVEKQIRLAMLRTMRESLKLKMRPKKNRVRRVDRIASRNPAPK